MRYDQVHAFHQLGLSPGADEQAIKRAYAQKIKSCNPETDAENWMRLHNAYKLALSALQENDNTQDTEERIDVPPVKLPPMPVDSHEDDGSEFDSLFDNLENLAQDAALQEEQYQVEYKAAVRAAKSAQAEKVRKPLEQRIHKLCRLTLRRKLESEDLKNLFQSPDFQTASGEAWCVELLYPLLQSGLYERKLTLEAKDALSLQLCELYQMQHPECPDAFALRSKLVADTRAQAEKMFKVQGRVCGWIIYLLLILLVYLPELYVSDIEYAQSASLYASLTMQECIRSFTRTDGYWRKEGDTIVVSAGDGDREIHAVFTLDEDKSNVNFPFPFYSKSGSRTRRVYVLSFQVGSYTCKGRNDLEDFGIDISRQEQGMGFFSIPWEPGSGDAAREFIRNMGMKDRNVS